MKNRIPIEDLRPFIEMAAEEMNALYIEYTVDMACDYYGDPKSHRKKRFYTEDYDVARPFDLIMNAMYLQAELTRSLSIGVCVKEDAA